MLSLPTTVFVLTVALVGIAKADAIVSCEIHSKFSCSTARCDSVASSVANRIDLERGTYSRCDSRGCDDYNAVISRSGDFLNIALPEHGMLAKVSTIDGGFLEVVTVGLSTLISSGTCVQAK